MIEVTITVKRGKEEKGKSYLLTETGKSKKGTFKTFSPADNPDLPGFSKVYVKATRGK